MAAAPRLAAGGLPFLATFAALLVPVTVADLAAGHVHADRALAHLLLLSGVVAGGDGGLARPPAASPPRCAGSGCPREACLPACWSRSLLGWSVAGIATAGPAAAHASLVSTDPGEGARLATAPAQVTLEFSEGVSLGAGYARVLSAEGERVDTGTASVDGGVLTIPLRAGLPDDGYLVTYRVVSADSHPISGAFSFVVGDGELVPAGAAAADTTDPVVARLLPAARWLGFAGLALAIGVPVLAPRLLAGRLGVARGCAPWPAGGRSRSPSPRP